MAESKPITTSNSSSDKDERHIKNGETHGLRDDIDEDTPIFNVKAPNVFERAKEEIEAIVEAIHSHNKDSDDHGSSSHWDSWDSIVKAELKSRKFDANSAEKDGKVPNFIEKAKEEIVALLHKESLSPRHKKETHGMSDDIDENTPIDEVQGPSVFERAKEEVEALIHTIHPKKESSDYVSSPKKPPSGLRISIGKGLEKICSPRSHS